MSKPKEEMFIIVQDPLTIEGGIGVDEICTSLKEAKTYANDELLHHYDNNNYGRYIYKIVPVLTLYREEQEPKIIEIKH